MFIFVYFVVFNSWLKNTLLCKNVKFQHLEMIKHNSIIVYSTKKNSKYLFLGPGRIFW